MLTDKQIFIYCGLLSLCFHFVVVGMYYTNGPSLRQNIKMLTPTIQVTLIDLGSTPAETVAEKKEQKENPRPVGKQSAPVVASEISEPEMSPPPEPIKKVQQHVAQSLPPQQFSRDKLQAQPQQPHKTLPSPGPVAVERPEEPFRKQAASVELNEPAAAIEHHGKKEESSSSSDKHTLSEYVPEQQREGDSVDGQDYGLDPVYLISIREQIEKHIDYPARARRLRLTGKVNLSFKITATGDLDDIHILAESPYPLLNKAVILAVKQAAPFPQPRREMSVELPILFSLKRS